MMTKTTMFVFSSLVALALFGCDDSSNSQTLDTQDALTDQIQEDSDIQEGSDTQVPVCSVRWADVDPASAVQNDVTTLGVYANTITIDGEFAYVVNSGDNTIQRYSTADPAGSSNKRFVDEGTNKNPFDLAIYGDRIYITNSFEGSITVAALSTGAVLSTTILPELVSPQDIVATEGYLLVANTEFTFPAPSERFGSLVVLSRSDTPALVNRIPTTQSNPQFVRVVGDTVYVVNSGRTDYDMDTGIVSPGTDGGLDTLALSTLAAANGVDGNVSLPPSGLVGNPGTPTIVGTTMFLGSGTASVLFQIDLSTLSAVRGTNAPIVLGDTGTSGFAVPSLGPDGLLYVADFNNDKVSVFDPACGAVIGQPIGVGSSAEMMEGPFDMAWDASGKAHIVMSVSSSLTVLDPSSLTH